MCISFVDNGGSNAKLRDTNIYTPELLPPKGSQKGAKGSKKRAKGSQKGAKGSQKGAKDQENHQKSCLGAFEVIFVFSLSFFLQNCKNGHGALVGITKVKGTSVDEFFKLFEKRLEKLFLALVGIT